MRSMRLMRLAQACLLGCLLLAGSSLLTVTALAEGQGEAPADIEHPPVDFTGSEGTPPIAPEPPPDPATPTSSSCQSVPANPLASAALVCSLLLLHRRRSKSGK